MHSSRNGQDKLPYLSMVSEICRKCKEFQESNSDQAIYTWHDEYNNYQFSVYHFQYQSNQSSTPISVLIFVANDILEDSALLNNLSNFYEKAIVGIEANELSNKIGQGQIIFSGFSIGAGLAQIAACYYNKAAIAFEAPGMKPVLETCLKENKHQYTRFEETDITTFLTVPNEINTWGEQIGNIRRIYLRHVDKTSYWHIGMSTLGIVDGAMTLFSLGSYAYAKTASKTVVKASSNVSFWKEMAEGSTKSLIDAEKRLAETQMDKTLHIAKESLIKFQEHSVSMFSEIKASNFEALSKATSSLEAAEKTLGTANNILKGTTGLTAVTTTITRTKIPMDVKMREKLLSKGQHTLHRIIGGLSNNQSTLVKTKDQDGYIFSMKHWPTTLSQSWGTIALNFGRSFIPFRPYNPGIMNIHDENICIEANVELMDGYETSSLTL